MDKIGLVLVGMVVVCAIAYCTVANDAESAPPAEYELASAYHCGMLDALQQKIGRGRACDVYKEIAKKKGVSVPP